MPRKRAIIANHTIPNQAIALSATLEILAAADEKKLPTFSMTAYTGAAMRLSGWDLPVVVDLNGLDIPSQQRPVRLQHDANKGVGHTTKITKTKTDLLAEGLISRDTSFARDVTKSGVNGFPWQASIGADPVEVTYIPEGEKVKANGQTFDGPVYHVGKSILNEISFVDLGADGDTSARIAAKQVNHLTQENDVMKLKELRKLAQTLNAGRLTVDQLNAVVIEAAEADEDETAFKARIEAAAAKPKEPSAKPDGDKQPIEAKQETDPIAARRQQESAESARIAGIRTICAGKHSDIEVEAIRDGFTVEKTELAVLRASRPQTAPNVNTGAGGVQNFPLILEASAVMSCGMSDDKAVKLYTLPVVEAAHKQFKSRMTIQRLLLEAANAAGCAIRFFNDDPRKVLEAAFSSLDISGILSNVANKFMVEGYMSVDQSWRKIAAIRSVKDFKSVTGYRLIGNLEYLEVGPTGQIKDGDVSEASYSNQAKTYGRILRITRTQIINDDMDALSKVPRMIGRGGAIKFCKVFWTVFQANTDSFYSAANKNLIGGAALAIDSLTTADQYFMDQTDENGDPTSIRPVALLVGSTNKTLAERLYKDTHIISGTATAKQGSGNPHTGKYEPIATPYVANTTFGGVAGDWYLIGDPNDIPCIEACFLNGVETPTVESAAADFDELGIKMRGVHDFGVNKQEKRSIVKNTVAAL